MDDRSVAPVKVDEEYDVNIETIGAKGDGIAKIERFTVFVPNTKVGDSVKIKIENVLPKFAFAKVVG